MFSIVAVCFLFCSTKFAIKKLSRKLVSFIQLSLRNTHKGTSHGAVKIIYLVDWWFVHEISLHSKQLMFLANFCCFYYGFKLNLCRSLSKNSIDDLEPYEYGWGEESELDYLFDIQFFVQFFLLFQSFVLKSSEFTTQHKPWYEFIVENVSRISKE